MQIPHISGLAAKGGKSQIKRQSKGHTRGTSLKQRIQYKLNKAAINFFSVENNMTPQELECLQKKGMVIPASTNPFVTVRDSIKEHLHNGSPLNWQASLSPQEREALEERNMLLHKAA